MSNTKGIFRLSRRERFAQIDTHCLEDQNLSWKAKGMLAYLMSRTDDWMTRVQHLKTVSTDGRIATASGLRELIENDYARRRQPRDEEGKVKAVEYWIVEAPPEVLRQRMPEEEYQAFREEWEKWPAPHKEKEKEDTESEESDEPQSGNLIADEDPQSENLIADENDPQSGNLIAVKTPESENLIADENPQSGNPHADDPHADNLQLRKNDLTKEGTTYDRSGRSVVGRSRAIEDVATEEKTPTDEPTDRPSIEEGTERYVEWVALTWEVDWSQELREDISGLFAPWDGPAGRAWLEQKMKRLAGKYSDIGVADMVRRDIQAGECPPPAPVDDEKSADDESGGNVGGTVRKHGESASDGQSERQVVRLDAAKDEWGGALLELREMVSEDNFRRWFEKLEMGGRYAEDEERFLVLVEDDFYKAWLEDNYLDLLEKALGNVVGREVNVELVVDGAVEVELKE